ncbi:Metal-dependent hydrolase, endonuclease/exonuclease/phosphatase family [Thiohalospira halophila DSM 15071]|uniref:Metal-dependent hydrolase, endonuclease/exonuclease/phosphatase family n=1 Tax=Thiohalospira halophila DSM 15071 TaxID=1123397 RepID=A0A1I1P8E3_9GAMM|nr:endonuclease/exonuclease/phosphatase family protein [Thiohalospira halophila]SFD05985.1 Metal-dependent hydrolase, endonuclease/exonuclease/phosphatase family [Thiohalospira halophila DSM 15071]
MEVRIASWNIHGALGGDGRHDPARTAAVIDELAAEVIALQEVDGVLLGEVAAATGLTPIAGPTGWRRRPGYGNALLTSARLVRHALVDLSQPGREPRGAVDADLLCHGRPVRVLATHLGLRPGERRRQTRALLTRLAATGPSPTLLLGDLNEWFLWGRPLRWLRRHFGATPTPATFPARWPLLALDRIWVEPRAALRALWRHDSPLARRASDHQPLLARVELP